MGMMLFLGTWGLERMSMGKLDECQALVMLSVGGGLEVTSPSALLLKYLHS